MEYKSGPGRIYAEDAYGKLLAEVTFPAKGGVATINHTFVDDSLRGQGIAGELVKRAVETILHNGDMPAATCSYAAMWLKRHPEYIANK